MAAKNHILDTAAMKAGKWSSSVARQGLWHKAGMIVSVIAAGIADIVIGIICKKFFPVLSIKKEVHPNG